MALTKVSSGLVNADLVISGGTVDNSVIGGSTAAAGSFTTISAAGAVTVGVDDTGYDVKFFGATSGAYLLWDESADKLLTAGGAVVDIVKDKLLIGGTAVTTTAAELNILDGVTATSTELNLLDGVTSTTTELNYLDITTLGTTEASKAVTADANGVVKFDNGVQQESTALTSGTSVTLDLNAGTVFTITLAHNIGTFTWSNPASSGYASVFSLKVTQDGTGGRTISWPASVDWASGTAPTLSSGANDVDVFVFFTVDGGTTYYGFTSGQDLS
tara:strand:+ start:228 stop:1046 length:819 start_codon:yes stop_codon:yes gene_type:complete